MPSSQRITPCLWFDDQAEEAAGFYASFFQNSAIGRVERYTEVGQEIHGRQAGSVMTVELQLEGQDFLALNGGPLFQFNPSISFLIACASPQEVDGLWARLAEGGTALMPLGEYPFSARYGWIQDRYGVSWQVMFMGDRPIRQKIIPTLMFVGEQYGRAEEAMQAYVSIFPNASVGAMTRYGRGEEPDREGTVKHGRFTLAGQEFAAMDSGYKHEFAFNEAVSLIVNCASQPEVDAYWEALSAGGDPEAQQCGWLKDRYGVSWQVVPTQLAELLGGPLPGGAQRATQAMFQMKKLDLAQLQRAYEGKP